ncbi:MAG: hypothetical protein QXH07_07115 [Thermoplasmata archaeon]
MSNYANGAARERRIMHKLEAEGWSCFRMAGSHSPIDIIAIRNANNNQEFMFIQSKKSHYLNPQQRIAKKELEDKLGISIVVM